jgi:hypothetical protein
MYKINPRTIAIIILLIIIVILTRCNQGDKSKIEILEQNQKSLTDSVRVSTTKIGELEYSKNILVGEKNDVVKLNKKLAYELKNTKGKVSELTQYIIKIGLKPTPLLTTIINTDSEYIFTWGIDTVFNPGNGRSMKGETIFTGLVKNNKIIIDSISTTLLKDELTFSVIQGLREKDGNLEVFVRSNYPGFELQELNSIIINPEKHPVLNKFTNKSKPKRFGVGVYGGYGIGVNGLSPQIGVGLFYNLLQF